MAPPAKTITRLTRQPVARAGLPAPLADDNRIEVRISDLMPAEQANLTDQIEVNQAGLTRRVSLDQVKVATKDDPALHAPLVLLGRSDDAPDPAPAYEITLDPLSMEFKDGRLASKTPGLKYLGTGDYTQDVPAVQALIDLSSATGLTVELVGDIEIGWGAVGSNPVPDYYRWSNPQNPVYNAIHLRSNIRVDGTRATFRFAPVPFVGAGGKYSVKPKWAAFGSAQNIEPRTLNFIEFFGCSFDFTEPAAGPIAGTQPFCIVGCSNVRIYACRFYNVPRQGAVTLTNDGAGNVRVTWPDDSVVDRSVIAFQSPVVPGMTAGKTYYVRNVTGTTFAISEVDNGELVAFTGADVATTAEAVPTNGFALELNNLDDSMFWANDFRFLQQGYFVNYCRNIHWRGDNFIEMNEGFDIQTTMSRASIVGCTFSGGWNEGQSIDGSGLVDTLISANLFDRVRTPIQVYAKSIPAKFSEWAKGYYWIVDFAAGTPGTVLVPPECHPYVGMRVWFEYIPKPVLGVVTDPVFPGESAPAVGDGGMKKYTTYICTGVAVDGRSFDMRHESKDVDGNTILSPPLPAYGYPIADAAVLTFTTTGSPGCVMHVMTDTPLDFVQCRNVTVCDNVGTNLITSAQDPDPNDLDPQPTLGARIMLIGVDRLLREGIDRGQLGNMVPTNCSNIRVINNSFNGGRVFEVLECENLLIDNLDLSGTNPGADSGGVSQYALNLQAGMTTVAALAQSILSGIVRNVRIYNTMGRAASVAVPNDFVFENIIVDGFNRAGFATAGTIITIWRIDWHAGKVRVGPLTVRNGVAGAGQCLAMRVSTYPPALPKPTEVYFRTPMTLIPATGMTPLISDVNSFIAERATFILPRTFTTVGVVFPATIRVPILQTSKQSHHLLAVSLICTDPITVFNATNYTSCRIIKVTAAGVVTTITGFVPIDNVARAINAEIEFVFNTSGNSAEVQIAADDSWMLEFRREGTGSAMNGYLTCSYYALPFTVTA